MSDEDLLILASDLVQALMQTYLEQAYVDRYVSESAKADVENMVRDLIAVFHQRIENLEWMNDATKEGALRKLDALRFRVGYADLGSLACLTQIVSRQEHPDYETLYRTAARTWRLAASREAVSYHAQTNIHAADVLRGQLPLQACGQFYETFGITEGDGMWIPPEERVSVW